MAEAAVERLIAHNDGATLAGTRVILTKVLGNLAADPSNEKFQKLRQTNATIKAKILNVIGAVDVLAAAGFRDEGEFLVASDADGAKAVLAALRATEPPVPSLAQILPHAGGSVRGIAVDADGTIGTASLDNVARLWQHGGISRELVGHTAPKRSDAGVNAVGFGTDVYTAGRDGALIAWKRDGSAMTRLLGHGEPIEGEPEDAPVSNAQIVSCVCVLDSNTVLTGGWDRTMIAWEMVGDALPRRYGPFGAAVTGIACLGDVAGVASGDGVLYYIDPRSTPSKASLSTGALECRGTPMRAVASSKRHNCFATVSNDSVIRLWEDTNPKLLRGAPTGSEGMLFAVAVGDDACYAAGDDMVVFAWTMPFLEPLFRLAHPAEIRCMAVNISNGDLIVGCEDHHGCFVWSSDPANALPEGPRSSNYVPAQEAVEIAKQVDLNPPQPAEGALAVFSKKRPAASSAGGISVASAGTDGRYDYSFPVELGQAQDGLTLNWNRGDDPNVVAYAFLQENRIPTSDLQQILNFIAQAQGDGIAAQAAAPPSAGTMSPEVEGQMIAQVMSLGVDEAKARAALEQTGWTSVEQAINSIFS